MRQVRTAVHTLAVILLVSGTTQLFSPCQAQDRGGAPKIASDERDFETRQNILRGISEHKSTPKEARPRSPEVVMAEARGDYMGIQVANKALKQAITADTPLDLQFISNSVSDIRKRAERLSSSLTFPEPEKDAEHAKISSARDQVELKASLANLSTIIRSFVTNPCFRATSLSAGPETTKAGVDLEDIITLTKQLQKDTARLEKAAAKNESQ